MRPIEQDSAILGYLNLEFFGGNFVDKVVLLTLRVAKFCSFRVTSDILQKADRCKVQIYSQRTLIPFETSHALRQSRVATSGIKNQECSMHSELP